MRIYERIYVDGGWRAPVGGGHLEVVEAATEEVMGRIPEGEPADAETAVAAARRAFEPWAATPVAERADFLERLGRGLKERQRELAELIAREVGMPLRLASMVQAGLPARVLASTARLVRDYAFDEEVAGSLVVREPVGVVAAITPWNYPLHQVVAKVAPALAAGCTVVVKPSEVAPLSAFVLAEVVDAVGLPPGVFNLVSGLGPVVGEALARHPEVDMVSFTGSTRAGRRVAELAAPTVKRVAQELGGKSASLVLDDADFERAVDATVKSCLMNSGQTCSAWTRLLVPREREEEAAELARRTAEAFVLGDPLDEKTTLGPLVSELQRERVRTYLRTAIAEGARLVTGGPEPPPGLERGYFVRPTVFAGVRPEMTIAREEVFGPVLAILPHAGEDDAVRLANDSIYGLGGAVWSRDLERAKRVARRLRTGQVDVNGGRFNLEAPFGGYKQSGNGRELGRHGLEEYLEVKSIQL